MIVDILGQNPDGNLVTYGQVDTSESDVTIAKIWEDAITIDGVDYVSVATNRKKRICKGYAKKSDFDQLTTESVSIPENFAGLEAVMVPTRLEEQLFRVVKVEEDDDCVTITARHVWYDNLQNNTIWEPTENTNYSAGAACRNVLENAISPCHSRVATDCTDELPGKELDFNRKNLVEAFLDPEKGICAKYGLSLIRNNWDFYCLKEVGYNRGIVIQDKKNLLGVQRHESYENIATRVCPYAKDAEGNILWMNNNGVKWLDADNASDYAYPRVLIYDSGLQVGKDDVTAQNIQARLLESAQKKYSEEHVNDPEIEMTVELISLGDTEEYAQYRDLDKVYLYDIITIINSERGYQYTAQVVGVVHDVLTGRLLSVTIGKLDNWDGTRKIAVWQVPEISGENIRLKSILAGSFAPGAIQSADIGEHIINYAHFASATIDSLVSTNITAVTAQIHQIIAGSITAEDITTGSLTAAVIAAGAITTEKLAANSVTAAKIDAGAITTQKLAANSVTADKVAAGAITADKLDAGVITADKISTTDLNAINAKLGTANIANAQIAVADINFAHIKDLNAQSAYFGQAIFDEAVGGKLYVPRLAVGYAAMIGATIGDLVIQASNGNYYGIDVDLNGNVTATQRTVTAGEIASGHTTDGRTLVLGTDILATDLNTQNIYASHALMNEINAAIINVDELWARQAFIGKLMTTDISSNTYIQATIGNWVSGSTITQTINSLDSRISSLGYGTVYCQPDEPSHGELVSGDIWIQTLPTATWNDIYNDFATWQVIYDDVSSWQVLGGIPKMFVWDGQHWQEMYDAELPNTLTTQIQQLSDAITLKASISQVDELGAEVELFAAELSVQAQQIQSAVSAVNTKASSYVMWADPRTAYTVSIGDIWIKQDAVLDTWQDVYDEYTTWQVIYNTYTSWYDLLGAATYVWNGSEWVETSDRASEIYNETIITQTSKSVEILATQQAEFQGSLVTVQANLTIAANEIRQEVSRATAAEGGKLDKTVQYQTADDIVAVASTNVAPLFNSSTRYTEGQFVTYEGKLYRFNQTHQGQWNSSHVTRVYSSNSFLAQTSQYQTADAIVSEAVAQAGSAASGNYISKTTKYQTATDIVSEAVSQATTAGNGSYIKKTSQYQTAASIVTEAVSQANNAADGSYIKKTNIYQTAEGIKLAAEEEAATNIVPAFSTSTAYVTGDYVSYNGDVYRFKQSHSAGAWNASHVDKKKVSDYVADKAYLQRSGIQILAAGVAISGNKYIKLDVNANNYVHIDQSGIEVKGNRIKVNDKEVFARDDIIIMNPTADETWRRTVAGIESHQSGAHDWVLIRPYYDAKIMWNLFETYTIQAASVGGNVAQLQQEAGLAASFGTSSTYQYIFKFTIPVQNFTELGLALTIANNQALTSNVITQSNTYEISAVTPTTIEMTINSPINLCGENASIFFKIEATGRNVGGISDVSLTCKCNSTTSRVPCTTYYYP